MIFLWSNVPSLFDVFNIWALESLWFEPSSTSPKKVSPDPRLPELTKMRRRGHWCLHYFFPFFLFFWRGGARTELTKVRERGSLSHVPHRRVVLGRAVRGGGRQREGHRNHERKGGSGEGGPQNRAVFSFSRPQFQGSVPLWRSSCGNWVVSEARGFKKTHLVRAPAAQFGGAAGVSLDGPENPNLYFRGTDQLPYAVKVLPCIMCGDSNVAEQWIIGDYAMGRKYKDKFGHIQITLHLWWKRKMAYPVEKVDDYVKHTFREHNQEADHLGTEGHKDITIESEAVLAQSVLLKLPFVLNCTESPAVDATSL